MHVPVHSTVVCTVQRSSDDVKLSESPNSILLGTHHVFRSSIPTHVDGVEMSDENEPDVHPNPQHPQHLKDERTSWRTNFDHASVVGDTHDEVTNSANGLRDQSNADVEHFAVHGHWALIVPRFFIWCKDRWKIERTIKAAYDAVDVRKDSIETSGTQSAHLH